MPAPPTRAEISAQGTRSVQAADGSRLIEYSVVGSARADARVVVSGFGAKADGIRLPSRWAAALDGLNVREVMITLPGLGWSSIQPGYRIADWPRLDVEPVLAAEHITAPFYVYGYSLGSLHAMAMAQHFGPERVLAWGVRAPWLPLPLSQEEGLPSQSAFPTTEELEEGTFVAYVWKWFWAWCGTMTRSLLAPFARVHPEEAAYQGSMELRMLYNGYYGRAGAFLWNLARDVSLDCPGLDVRSIDFPGNRTVVWYGAHDENCPGAHGKWLAEHFHARVRVFNGSGLFAHVGPAVLDQAGFLAELLGV